MVNKGEEITAKVIKLDPEHKKIGLSIKEYLIDKNKFNRDDIVVGGSKSHSHDKKRKKTSLEEALENAINEDKEHDKKRKKTSSKESDNFLEE